MYEGIRETTTVFRRFEDFNGTSSPMLGTVEKVVNI